MASNEKKSPGSEDSLKEDEVKKKDAGFLKNYGVRWPKVTISNDSTDSTIIENLHVRRCHIMGSHRCRL